MIYQVLKNSGFLVILKNKCFLFGWLFFPSPYTIKPFSPSTGQFLVEQIGICPTYSRTICKLQV